MHVSSRVNELVFDMFPSFTRGLVLARLKSNTLSDVRLERLLEATASRRRIQPIELDHDARIRCWIKAHEHFGSNPRRNPPAHLALLRRVQRPSGNLPYINTAVCIMNLVSIEIGLPVGGDDLDLAAVLGSPLTLRLSNPNDRFLPLGRDRSGESCPAPGEVVYAAGNTVLCRRWNWRNSRATMITPSTRLLLMNTDGIGDTGRQLAVRARDRVASLLKTYCDAHITLGLLSSTAPEFDAVA